ncbi:major facilitator superfamily domain-containing protein [Radiomyces spectabilis]|uniref:major facilitator superfamily domain-containing protein n=1 Tax=Radiomyces spectabilis TaxID=64574 RepID=UPI00221FACDC|nr:major facilitator superfamily domain-containing protein [Radiomyces spectabilis]KAI8364689.1 major facilitator superfamily domain-containing protein [Radiomyces spectabilis]
MIGNIMSTAIWLFARSFVAFLFARVIAGLSEGNVQLSIAIISDITTPERRSRNLAFIGIAFAIAFTFGPALGAWFASFDLTTVYPFVEEWGVYPYSTPALVGLVLLLVETGYLYAYLPETFRHRHMNSSASRSSAKESTEHDNTATRLSNLCYLNAVQCIYSFLFSGMEFTLVFLTFDVLDYTHMQQGKLLGFMGILSALIQGGYVRRRVQRLGEKSLVIQGMVACAMGLAGLSVMAMVPTHASLYLYGSVSCLAFASGTVANCLTSLASLQCHEGEENEPRLAKGRALGEFRSYGQLGRAFGPISACGLYWMMGPTYCYCTGAIAMLLTTVATTAAVPVHKQKKA